MIVGLGALQVVLSLSLLYVLALIVIVIWIFIPNFGNSFSVVDAMKDPQPLVMKNETKYSNRVKQSFSARKVANLSLYHLRE